ncbi:MAG TPA: FAD-dependent oxidoreductase [Candidatus Sulfotelmatobacter sp.]|nr:FAD-dependent oxidoreductase [Candidatus Sulfotelmatobacter sp.]
MPGTVETSCCIVGGGPAGMMLGFLLARMGGKIIVLEKHADFLRDFRGDTIHPSTLELMYELGLLQEFLQRPHQEVTELAATIGQKTVKVGDFTHLPTHCKMLAFMPQWDFLNFLVEHGQHYPSFQVCMKTEVTGLIEEHGEIVGARANTPDGPLEIRAALTVGADGRRSVVRERAGLKVTDLGAPMDVLWLRISRRETDPSLSLGHAEPGVFFVMINRQDYWQCGYVIAKGAFDDIQKRGIAQFREDIVRLAPFFRDRVSELRDWNDVSLLTVKVDRLEKWWRPGLLCIGDAAHAMSPIGGVGINLAIQDAVAAANVLGEKLIRGEITASDLQAVQRRRTFPTRATQKLQVLVQNRVVRRVLTSQHPLAVPWPVKLMQHFPSLRRLPARVIGIGFRPEHIHTPERP